MQSSVRLIAAFFIVTFGFLNPAKAADINPLKPVDASSPRATLQGFGEIMDQTYRGMADVLKSYAGSDRLYLSPEERRSQTQVLLSGLKANQFLDTSGISPVLRDTVTIERLLQLKEIFDRIELPSLNDIPNREAIAQSSAKKWRLPGTAIDIVLIENGPRAGEWLVSADTVNELPEFYEQVKDLPYKPGPAKQLADVYRTISPSGESTIYGAFSSSPLGLQAIVPVRWMLNLPGWAKADIAGIAVWQWLARVFSFFVCLGFVFGVYRLARRLARRGEDELGPGWYSLLTPLAVILLAGIVGPLLDKIFRISGSPLVVIAYAQTIALFLSAAWLCMIGANLLGETIAKAEHLRPHSLDNQLIRLGARFVGIVVAIGLLLHAGDQLGFPAYSVVAGLGVGGLAVALAARDSLANLFGSVLIMFEKPFRVGQRIRLSGSDGVVEDVGFRSTRIRTMDNSLISIPNNTVVNATVENMTLRTMFRQRLLVQVTYDTPRDRLDALLDGIRQLLAEHPATKKDNFHVRFNDFGESSLNILVIFHLMVVNYAAELSEREDILLKIMDLAQEIGVEFAFPTRTLHLDTMPTAESSSSVSAGGGGAAAVTPFVPRDSLSTRRGASSLEEPR
jgi:MscS family membrane protein